MYRFLLSIFLLILIVKIEAQVPVVANKSLEPAVPGEFGKQPHELLYSDADIKTLRFIVDSLNLRFKTCDLNRTYYSVPQVNSMYIAFRSDSNDLQAVIADIKNNISFYELSAKYASLKDNIDSAKLIIKRSNYYLSGWPYNGYNNVTLSDDDNFDGSALVGKWVYTYYPKDKYSPGYSLYCHFFPSQWQQQPIPDEYARLIQYVDCMIDTSSKIILVDKFKRDKKYNRKRTEDNVRPLIKYINKRMPKEDEEKDEHVSKNDLTTAHISFATKELSNDAVFKKKLSRAFDRQIRWQAGSPDLESLAKGVGLYDKALQLRRSYHVVGYCSMDEGPRYHARDIATLAARSHSWNIFLRAHLDIMNDRFDRKSDGSYAWGGRKTYLKELEELNLNIVDLMLGMTLRASNVSSNHYNGTVWRLGWALTESKEQDIFEQRALAMMKDSRLDEFNRSLIFLLYRTYLEYLSKEQSLPKITAMKKDIASYPDFMRSSIETLKPASEK